MQPVTDGLLTVEYVGMYLRIVNMDVPLDILRTRRYEMSSSLEDYGREPLIYSHEQYFKRSNEKW